MLLLSVRSSILGECDEPTDRCDSWAGGPIRSGCNACKLLYRDCDLLTLISYFHGVNVHQLFIKYFINDFGLCLTLFDSEFEYDLWDLVLLDQGLWLVCDLEFWEQGELCRLRHPFELDLTMSRSKFQLRGVWRLGGENGLDCLHLTTWKFQLGEYLVGDRF